MLAWSFSDAVRLPAVFGGKKKKPERNNMYRRIGTIPAPDTILFR